VREMRDMTTDPRALSLSLSLSLSLCFSAVASPHPPAAASVYALRVQSLDVLTGGKCAAKGCCPPWAAD
jgi:hypothetical protein